MLEQKYIPIQDYENSTVKHEYQYLYRKDDEIKCDINTVEDEGVNEYADDFFKLRNYSLQTIKICFSSSINDYNIYH